MSNEFKTEPGHWVLIVFLLVALYASYLLIEPFMGPVVLAFVLSLLCFPVHQRIVRKFPDKPNLASTLTCSLLVVVILVPATLVIMAIVQQGITFAKNSYQWVESGGAEQLLQQPLVKSSINKLNEFLPTSDFSIKGVIDRLAEFASGFSNELLNLSTKVLGDVTGMIISFFLMLFVLFFLLRDHKKIIESLYWVLPLARSQEEKLLKEANTVARSAVMGTFLTALAQGVAGGIGMAIVGMPGLFWGTMMVFASLIPVVGAALIWVPASLYLILTGDWPWALFLTLWGAILVGSIDNFLRPVLMQGTSNMSTLVLFLSLIGGLQLFGVIGLIYGPIIFALTHVLIKLYTIEFRDFLEKQDNS
ncbi:MULTISPECIES: AI-2E family transporter [unclassified Arsukibacterium]|uniref:AI-2E family transporter n=1 Tax=unclassified Arsukibacterium TaxID=2635278 RepID=UPI000C414DDF|nr:MULTISPECIES: AI-2E family transporter [unclassified Arsukibacterium]MAA95737.1 AI-2E family transporter [Rheinheimera sp.]MBM34555.1 AI-2E family transporter [Rheinheimera sp.]HAW91572.1 AI-2E family transporter [Candidatus Azambacteria bacterium]